MLWRVRTSLADRPGALAEFAARCGQEEVNILGLQIFPGIDNVTDEFVLRTHDDWTPDRVQAMVESAGGTHVAASSATGYALVDGPTNYLLAARHVVEAPDRLEQALSELLDANTSGSTDPGLAILEVPFRDSTIVVRREAPFTVTEQARAEAFVSLVSDLVALQEPAAPPAPAQVVVLPSAGLEPEFRLAALTDSAAFVRMVARCSAGSLSDRFGDAINGISEADAATSLMGDGPALVAKVGSELVGLANISTEEPAEVRLLVEDAWQSRGIGTRLFSLAARLAKARGAEELVLRATRNIDAVPRLSASSGLQGRVRHQDGQVVLTVSLRRVTPLLHSLDGGLGPGGGAPGAGQSGLDPRPA